MHWRTRLQDLWRRLPTGARQRFWVSLAAARRIALPMRAALLWRRGTPPSGAHAGLIVAGLLRDTRGVAQAARLFADGAEARGLAVARVDVGETLGVAPVLPPLPVGVAPAADAPLVSCFNPPELLHWLERDGLNLIRGRRHIGYWAWELPEAPASWARALRYVDEVWCHSEFAAGAIRRLAARRLPVHVVMPPLFITPSVRPNRPRFGLPGDACVVLAAMDLRSSAERKNPLGALDAYLRAQPTPTPGVVLACKLSGLESDTTAARAVRAASKARSDIKLITNLLSEADMASLVASADIVLSLHRAEGFGLLAAEAAWIGRAVVTTAWSAPLEFLAPDGAALIGWTATTVQDSQGLYSGPRKPTATWAEPDTAAAAACLRELIATPRLRSELGERAAVHAREIFDPTRWVTHVTRLLDGA